MEQNLAHLYVMPDLLWLLYFSEVVCYILLQMFSLYPLNMYKTQNCYFSISLKFKMVTNLSEIQDGGQRGGWGRDLAALTIHRYLHFSAKNSHFSSPCQSEKPQLVPVSRFRNGWSVVRQKSDLFAKKALSRGPALPKNLDFHHQKSSRKTESLKTA